MKNLLLLSVLVLSLVSCNSKGSVVEDYFVNLKSSKLHNLEIDVISDVTETYVKVKDSVIVIKTQFNSNAFDSPEEHIIALEDGLAKNLDEIDRLNNIINGLISNGRYRYPNAEYRHWELNDKIRAIKRDNRSVVLELKRLEKVNNNFTRYSNMDQEQVLFKIWETEIKMKNDVFQANKKVKLQVNSSGEKVIRDMTHDHLFKRD
jgi:DNA repair exonuclease SbcCD ATPase subunit